MSRTKPNKSVYEEFCKNFNKLFEKSGLHKEAIAELLDVSTETIRLWGNCSSLPDINQLLSIKDKFAISIDYLLTGADSVKYPPEWTFSDCVP